MSDASREEKAREALEAAESFVETVTGWTGQDPDELQETLDCVRAALSALDGEGRQECHEDMGSDPCGKPAVGERLDPEQGDPYPVCAEHLRPPFVETLEESGAAGEAPAGLTRERIAWLEGVKDAAIGVANADDWRSGAEWDEALAGLVEALARHREPERTDEH